MRLPNVVFWILMGSWPQALVAQQLLSVHGFVKDPRGNAVPWATITLRESTGGSPLGYAISKIDGSFLLRISSSRTGRMLVSVEHLQWASRSAYVDVQRGTISLGPLEFVLDPAAKSLQEIVIRGEVPRFSIRGDTVEFRASAYRSAETRKVEDLLRNIQGFEVGSDGRISFNGKEVDRILVEGEDITEQHYQLLSKNLNAGLVEKVQVLHHYDPNRLMTGVSRSDKVGVNLTMNPETLQRWSGSLEAGFGTDAERIADINLVRLSKKFKWIQFFQHNSIGLPANADMNHYFRDGEKAGSNTEGVSPARGLLQTGSISPPSIGTAYTRDNNDFSGFVIGSWKASPSIRIKLLAGGADTRLRYHSYGSQEVFLPDADGWRLYFEDSAGLRQREGVMRLSLLHDGGKRNLGDFSFDFLQSRSRHLYANLSSGAVNDSLREQLVTRHILGRFRVEESFLLRPGLVMRSLVIIRRDRPEQLFQANTDRFTGYLGMDSGFNQVTQQLPGIVEQMEADITVSGRVKSIRWSAGLRSVAGRIRYDSRASLEKHVNAGDSLLGFYYTSYQSKRVTGYGQITIPVARKGQWVFAAAFGQGRTSFLDSVTGQTAASGVFRLLASFSHSPGPMQQWSFQWQSGQDVPPAEIFYPSGLFSGVATILDGSRQQLFPLYHSFQVNYAFNNLHKGSSWLCMVSGNHTNRPYNTGMEKFPDYTVLYPWSSGSNRGLNLLIKAEQFIRNLHSKFSLQVSMLYAGSEIVFNGIPSQNESGNFQMQPRWISAFKGAVNAELSMTSLYNANKTQPESGEASSFSQWQYQGYLKMKVRFSKKIYLALQYNGYRIVEGNYFQSLDCYAKWNVHRSWAIAFYGHNLLQTKVIENQTFSANQKSIQAFSLVDPYLMARLQWQF